MTPVSTSEQMVPITPIPRRHHRATPLPAQRGVLTMVTAVAAVPMLVLWPLIATGWEPLVSLDRLVATSLYGFMRPLPEAVHITEVWTETFGTWSMRVVALLAACWLLFRRQVSTAFWAAGTVVLANLFGLFLKITVDRSRPEFTDPLASGVGPSFPSGHALMAVVGTGVVLFATLPLLRGWLRTVAWTVAILVPLSTALSRPLLGVHWASDIVAGMSLGVSTLAATLLLWTFLPPIARRWDRPRPESRDEHVACGHAYRHRRGPREDRATS